MRFPRRKGPAVYWPDSGGASVQMGGGCRSFLMWFLVATPAVCAAGEFGGSLAGTSDYVYRGQSQTRGKPALQGEIHYQGNDWSTGAWASNVDLNTGPGATVEIDAYAGWARALGDDWNATVNLTHYFYPNDRRAVRYDYDEVTANLGYQARFFATFGWSPNTSKYSRGVIAVHKSAASYELSVNQPLWSPWSAVAGVGYYDLSELFGTGYWFWNTGVTYSMRRLQIAVSFVATDTTAKEAFGYEFAGSRWSGSVIWRF